MYDSYIIKKGVLFSFVGISIFTLFIIIHGNSFLHYVDGFKPSNAPKSDTTDTSSQGMTKIVSGSFDNTIKIWDLASGNLLNTLNGHTDYVHSVAVIPNKIL
jgi:WD40 repeat protein